MHKKVFWVFERACNEDNQFQKEKNEAIHKRTAGEEAKICYICKEKLENKYWKVKKFCKVRDHCHYTGECRRVAHSICNLKYGVPKKIHIAFHNGCN